MTEIPSLPPELVESHYRVARLTILSAVYSVEAIGSDPDGSLRRAAIERETEKLAEYLNESTILSLSPSERASELLAAFKHRRQARRENPSNAD